MKNRIKYRNQSVLVIQKIVRGFLSRKQHQPRYRGIKQIRAVNENVRKAADIAGQLRSSREVFLGQVADIENVMKASVQKIKVSLFSRTQKK